MMDNKCCSQRSCGGNVYINMNGGCTGEGQPEEMPCACVPRLVITIGEGGQFTTLTEALEYANTVVHNSLVIEMVSNVTETRTAAIMINGFSDTEPNMEGWKSTGIPPFMLKGNGYTLNLNSITENFAIGFVGNATAWLHNITILAQNITGAAVNIGTNAFLYLRQDVKIVGDLSKTKTGIYTYWGGTLAITYGNTVIENFKYGIAAYSMARAMVLKDNINFTNVTTNYFPAQNTAGNGNAYIYVE